MQQKVANDRAAVRTRPPAVSITNPVSSLTLYSLRTLPLLARVTHVPGIWPEIAFLGIWPLKNSEAINT